MHWQRLKKDALTKRYKGICKSKGNFFIQKKEKKKKKKKKNTSATINVGL